MYYISITNQYRVGPLLKTRLLACLEDVERFGIKRNRAGGVQRLDITGKGEVVLILRSWWLLAFVLVWRRQSFYC